MRYLIYRMKENRFEADMNEFIKSTEKKPRLKKGQCFFDAKKRTWTFKAV